MASASKTLSGLRPANSLDFAKDFLEFKILTLCPVDKQLVNKYLMSSGEISWLNNYHKQVYERLSPFLNASEKNWLKDACSPL